MNVLYHDSALNAILGKEHPIVLDETRPTCRLNL